MKHDNLLDIDGFNLFSELNILREIIDLKNNKLFDVLTYIKRMNSFPNGHRTYKIILTILVSVVSGDKNLIMINNVSKKIKWINHIIYGKKC